MLGEKHARPGDREGPNMSIHDQILSLRKLLLDVVHERSVLLLRTYQHLEPRISSPSFVYALSLRKPQNIAHQIYLSMLHCVYLSRPVTVDVFNQFHKRGPLPPEKTGLFHNARMVQLFAPRALLIIARRSGIEQRRSLHFKHSLLFHLNFFALYIGRNLFPLRQRSESSPPRETLKLRKYLDMTTTFYQRFSQVSGVVHIIRPEQAVACVFQLCLMPQMVRIVTR